MFLLSVSLPAPGQAKSSCNLPPLLHQRKDTATLQRLETAWNVAYLRGDTNFEQCLLTPDFRGINRKGEIHDLADELQAAAKNRGKNLPIPDSPRITILIQGDVATAYATTTSTGHNGEQRMTQNADYYFWKDGLWHAFFTQQTQVEDGGTINSAGSSGRSQTEQEQVQAVEQKWLDNENRADVEESILADDFIHVFSGGFITKDEQLAYLRKYPNAFPGAKHFENLRVRIYGDVAIANGIVVTVNPETGLKRTAFTDVFVRRGGKWLAVNAQELPMAEHGKTGH